MPNPSADKGATIHPRLLDRVADTIVTRTVEFRRLRQIVAADLQNALAHVADLNGIGDPAVLTALAAQCRSVLAILDEIDGERLPSQSALATLAARLAQVAEALRMATLGLDLNPSRGEALQG